MAITKGTITSASVQVRNDGDENKKYDIVATVTINKIANEFGGSNGNGQIQNGNVSFGGKTVATWSKYSNIAINYNVSDETEQGEILIAVQEFANAIATFVENVTLTAEVVTE